LRDVQLLLPPVSGADARAALSRLQGAALLERADIEAVIDVLVRFSELCLDLDDVFTEIDLNPLIVRSTGQGAVAVDSLFVLDL
jgi:succinyl-CoA synthetase beta subunit